MTIFKITNQTNSDVITYITLGATEGCIHDVSKLIFSDSSITIDEVAPLMGHFILKANSSTEVSAGNLGLNGNVSFNTPPMNCKTQELPNGMNLAEFIINNGFQQYGQETIDNSCVAGANALIEMSVDTDDWTSNWGKIPVTSFVNKKWDDNTGIVGVFPYGCDNCTSSNQPPECVGVQPQFANKEPICNVQRPANSNKGGTLEIKFLGFV